MSRKDRQRIEDLERWVGELKQNNLSLWTSLNETREYLIETRRALLEVMGIPPEAVPIRPLPSTLPEPPERPSNT